MFQLSPIYSADRVLVDTSARFVRLEEAVARANAHRQQGRAVRVREVTRSGQPGDFVGGALLVELPPLAKLRAAA